MKKYKIFVDTSADMPEDIAEKYNIGIIRFLNVFGEETYVSGKDLTNEQFYKKLEEFGDIPKTAQTPYVELYDTLKDASLEYETVIYFTISSKGSGQYNTAQMIRNEILEEDNPDADIRIFDTKKYSAYITATAVYATELFESGMNADEVLEKCQEYIESWGVYILVDTLKYLEKGGRINKTSAILGTLLDIKPVLTIKDGLIEPVEKLRGKKKLYKKLLDLIRENPQFDSENPEFMIVESNKQYAEDMKALIKEEFGVDELRYYLEFGPIVGTHIGPGTLAVIFRLKK